MGDEPVVNYRFYFSEPAEIQWLQSWKGELGYWETYDLVETEIGDFVLQILNSQRLITEWFVEQTEWYEGIGFTGSHRATLSYIVEDSEVPLRFVLDTCGLI